MKVAAGEPVKLRAKMEETVLTLDQDVVVVGEKPLFDIEETASSRNVGQADIQAAAVQNVQEIVAMQPGVVMSDNEIHIRGGRSYENAYLLDGISVQDPLAGTGFGLQLSPESIQEAEVITGGYNAEYGQATSGIVNITTREGADRYSGAFATRPTITASTRTPGRTGTPTSLTRPERPGAADHLPAPRPRHPDPGHSELLRDVLCQSQRRVYPLGPDLSVRTTGRPDYAVEAPGGLFSSIFHGTRWAPRRSNNYSWLGKLTYKPAPTMKIVVCL